MNNRSPDVTLEHTHIDTHLNKKNNNNTIATNETTVYTLCDVNTEDAIRHNIALVTSTSRVYIPYPLGNIIK